jgi:hypothetical protein
MVMNAQSVGPVIIPTNVIYYVEKVVFTIHAQFHLENVLVNRLILSHINVMFVREKCMVMNVIKRVLVTVAHV